MLLIKDHTWRINSMINWVTTQNLCWCDLSIRIFSNYPGDSNVHPWLKTILNQWFMASSDNYSLVRLCARNHVKVPGTMLKTFRSSTDPWTIKGNIDCPRTSSGCPCPFEDWSKPPSLPALFPWGWMCSKLLIAMSLAMSLLTLSS